VPPRPQTLDRRALNRALLARQLLLKRHRKSVSATLEHLVGMQAQAPDLPYVGLWSRLEGFETDQLSRLVVTRRAVRTSLMRNTIHLLTTRDALGLKPVFEPHAHRGFFRGSPWGRNITPQEAAAAIRAGKQLLDEKPRTVAEISKLLAAEFPGRDGLSLAYAVRSQLPLVFVPPRGVWRGSGPVALTTFEAWLGRGPGPALSPDQLVLRYLAAFGPASPADFRAWSGLAVREVFEGLRSRLVTFRSERGGELFDLPGAPRPSSEIDVPVRLLPDYDNVLLAHADRTRIMAPGQHLGLFSPNGIMKGSVLADGFVRAGWSPVQGTLLVTPFEKPLSRSERPPIEAEGMRLLALLAPGERHDVTFGPVKR
jgi:hypothetical protein